MKAEIEKIKEIYKTELKRDKIYMFIIPRDILSKEEAKKIVKLLDKLKISNIVISCEKTENIKNIKLIEL